MEQPKNYNQEFAEVYDELMSKTKYEQWKLLLQKIIKKYNISKGNVLDIACGTGEISKALLELGFEKVFGLDKSRYMLDIARKKLNNNRFTILEKDMIDIGQFNQYDLIVSFYDSINYLLEPAQVARFLEGIEKALKPGGFAIFDMNTKEHVKISQKNPEKIFPIKDGIARFKSEGEGNIWKLNIEIKKENQNFREIHLERGYSSEEIESMIKKTNLLLLELISEDKVYWDKKKYLSRQYYILQKHL